ncbi:N4-gp56 family major capsid protein [Streptococcus mitis]|uniref:N4-gp56 family major capsid protein n=1 Tax=Streptococcus mitis TaxID=28037 RepID=UPI001C4FCCDF|nr:major capsid protein [Streptococcus phage MissF]
MTAGQTKLATMVNPEVMADMVSAKLPKLIKFTSLAYVETALQGRPGNTLKVPAWEYAGDAAEVGEGQAITLDQLSTKEKEMTIKKAAKGYEITDEALLSGLGDPLGQATYQLGLAIANKIDNDLVAVAKTATQRVADAPTTIEAIDKALDIFEDEEDARYVAIINPKDAIKLKTAVAKEWTKGSEIGADMVVSGTFGEVAGVQIVRSKKVDEGKGFIVKVSPSQTQTDDANKYGAFVIMMKRDVAIETDRDIIKKTTVITGDEHYGVYLYDPTRVVKFGEG